MIDTFVIYEAGLPVRLIRSATGGADQMIAALPAGTHYLKTNDDIPGLHLAPAYDADLVTIKA